MTRGIPRPDGKILIIGGGIANFNVASTFKGIIRALKEVKAPMVTHKVRIFVRRGIEAMSLADAKLFHWCMSVESPSARGTTAVMAIGTPSDSPRRRIGLRPSW
jgi:hypothetical protein